MVSWVDCTIWWRTRGRYGVLGRATTLRSPFHSWHNAGWVEAGFASYSFFVRLPQFDRKVIVVPVVSAFSSSLAFAFFVCGLGLTH